MTEHEYIIKIISERLIINGLPDILLHPTRNIEHLVVHQFDESSLDLEYSVVDDRFDPSMRKANLRHVNVDDIVFVLDSLMMDNHEKKVLTTR